jgi:hypothetical protein
VTEPVNLASQHEHDASKPVFNPIDSRTQKLVNVALQIKAASRLTELANAANQAVQKEAASLQHMHDLLNSVNTDVEIEVASLQHEIPAIPEREITLKNINDVLDDDETQIHIQNIKDTEDDINRMIHLYLSFVAGIVFLSMFVGGIALKNALKSD